MSLEYPVTVVREKRRGCGYRNAGKDIGIYLMGSYRSESCERLPFPADICPCCGGMFRQSRAFTWITPTRLFAPERTPRCKYRNEDGDWIGVHSTDGHSHWNCVMCKPELLEGERGGLMWVGKAHYSVQEFIKEAKKYGISRKLAAIPQGFELGRHWIYLAHPEVIPTGKEKNGQSTLMETNTEKRMPGIFYVFKPDRIDVVVKNENRVPKAAKKIVDRFGKDNVRLIKVVPEKEAGR